MNMESNDIDKVNILVVDDNHKNIVSMKSILSELDVNIYSAESGIEALQLVLRYNFAVVFLDVQMPEMDWYEVAKTMSSNQDTANIPIVFVTAIHNDLKNIKTGYAVGAIDYLSKPIDPQILLAKARIFIRLCQQQQSLKKMVKQLDSLASTDVLTGLANRHQFNYTLEKILANNKRYERTFALLLLDIDNFKLINDNYGHDVGDELLRQLSERLVGSLRDSDHVSRLGGDEFAIILSELNKPEVVGNIASHIIDNISNEFSLKNHKLSATVSIGIATYPFAAQTPADLFKYADVALYRAKDKGKNSFEYFTESLSKSFKRRCTIENELKIAIDKGEISVAYQPRFNFETGKIVGVEALARWNNAVLGDVSPVEFIVISEETGFINELGHYIIETSFKQFVEWYTHYDELTFSLAINLSPNQILNHLFIDDLQRLLEKYPIDPNRVEFEITESMFKGCDSSLETALSTIRDLGISFSIDDFGTGYSSLSRIKTLPIKTLKIDQSFVRDITEDISDAAVVKAIISLSQALGLQVVAEGVETEAQKSFLLKHNCCIAQGYLMSKPVDANSVTALLSQQV